MKKKIFSIFVLQFLFLLSTVFPAQAEETKPEQSSFILEAKDNLLNLQAEQASFKEILNEFSVGQIVMSLMFSALKLL